VDIWRRIGDKLLNSKEFDLEDVTSGGHASEQQKI